MNKSFFTILTGTFILLIIGFYNGYPLVYSDTGTYINSGFDKFIPEDRPIFYGLFLFFSSFSFSLWPVIIVQDIITSFVLYELIKTLVPDKKIKGLYLSIIAFLTFFTGMAWYSNQIMPDFMAPLAIILLYILLKRHGIGKLKFALLAIIFIVCLICHFSHVLIATGLLLCIWLGKLIYRSKFSRMFYHIQRKSMLVVTGLVVIGWLIFPLTNYFVNSKFVVSEASHIFYVSHLVDNGMLETILKENCGKSDFKDCKLCAYKDSLPRDAAGFIWSSQIIDKTGGWEGSKAEYEKIIRLSITKPRYLFMTLYKDFFYSSTQLFANEIGSAFAAYPPGSAPYNQISVRFPYELNNYLSDRQNLWNGAKMNFDLLNHVNTALMMGVFFFLIYFFCNRPLFTLHAEINSFLLFALAGVVINAIVTASLNNPYDRYQSRVSWLLPLAVVLFLYINKSSLSLMFWKSRFPTRTKEE